MSDKGITTRARALFLSEIRTELQYEHDRLAAAQTPMVKMACVGKIDTLEDQLRHWSQMPTSMQAADVKPGPGEGEKNS